MEEMATRYHRIKGVVVAKKLSKDELRKQTKLLEEAVDIDFKLIRRTEGKARKLLDRGHLPSIPVREDFPDDKSFRDARTDWNKRMSDMLQVSRDAKADD